MWLRCASAPPASSLLFAHNIFHPYVHNRQHAALNIFIVILFLTIIIINTWLKCPSLLFFSSSSQLSSTKCGSGVPLLLQHHLDYFLFIVILILTIIIINTPLRCASAPPAASFSPLPTDRASPDLKYAPKTEKSQFI